MTPAGRARWYRSAFAFSVLELVGLGLVVALAGRDRFAALDALAKPPTPGLSAWAAASAIAAAATGAAFLALVAFRASSSSSSELFFSAFFFLSLGVEAGRAGFGLLALEGGSMATRDLLARGLVFARTFGALALFAAGLHAAGYRDDKPWSAVSFMAFAAAGVSIALPVNSGELSKGLVPPRGFASLAGFFETVVALAAVANFALAARSRASRAFLAVAGGVGLALLGAAILRDSAGAAAFSAGLVLLWAGSLGIFVPLRRHYLWQ